MALQLSQAGVYFLFFFLFFKHEWKKKYELRLASSTGQTQAFGLVIAVATTLGDLDWDLLVQCPF